MESSPSPIPYCDVPAARSAYGRGTAVWAAAGRHQVEDDMWISLSLTPHVDYNLALLHGDSAIGAAPAVIDELARVDLPAMVMLAGSGLAAADALSDAGWVCTGAHPFMGKDHGPAEEDPCVRELGHDDLEHARHLAAEAFGVPDEVGAVVYADDALDREDAHFWGLFEDGALRCCTATQYVGGDYSVGWALSTSPKHQRSGYARRLMRAAAARRLADGPPIALLTASDAGRHLYEQEGYVVLEYWQLWSRPRWVLR